MCDCVVRSSTDVLASGVKKKDRDVQSGEKVYFLIQGIP